MSDKLITILIPAYNAMDYIIYTLESIKQQTFKEYTTYIFDDGSTDDSSILINDFIEDNSDYDFRLISLDHMGLKLIRKTSLSYVKTAYFCFLDSDDLLSPDFLEIHFNALSNSNADFSFSKSKSKLDDDFLRNSTSRSYSNSELIQPYLLKSFFARDTSIDIWNKLYKSSLLEKNISDFDDGIYVEDRFVFDIFSKAHSAIYINLYTHYYRIRNDSVSKTFNSSINDVFQIIGHFEKHTTSENHKFSEVFRLYHLLVALVRTFGISDNKEASLIQDKIFRVLRKSNFTIIFMNSGRLSLSQIALFLIVKIHIKSSKRVLRFLYKRNFGVKITI